MEYRLERKTSYDTIELEEYKLIKINKKSFGGNWDKIGMYMFEDVTHCLGVEGGHITANINGDTINNIGFWSTGDNNRELVKSFMKCLWICSKEYKQVNFWCYKDNARISKLMARKYKCKLINESKERLYYRFER